MSRRALRWTSLTAALLVVVHSVLWDVVRREGGTFIADNTELVAIGDSKATLFQLSLIADAFGSYLLTLPATVALWRLLRTERRELVDLLALGGVIYAAAGAVAAAVLAIGGEPLIREYADATGSHATSIATTFGFAMNAAIATWQVVCAAAGGVWLIGSGWLLRARPRWRWFARYSIGFGALFLTLGAAKALGLDFESNGPATAAFLPIAIWIGWLGIRLSVGDEGLEQVADRG